MEQAWPVDKYDVPRGDLEFWARKRGTPEISATDGGAVIEHDEGTARAAQTSVITPKRAIAISLVSFLLGFSVQTLI